MRRSLDREQQASYQLQVLVQDGGTPPRSATGTAYITVLDENDHAPSFLHVPDGRELLLQVGRLWAQGKRAERPGWGEAVASRLPALPSAQGWPQLLPAENSAHRSIVRGAWRRGAPCSKQPPEAPRAGLLCGGVCVLWGSLDGTREAVTSSVLPLCQVSEDKPAGLLVASLQARDPDEGENGTVAYSLSGTGVLRGCSLPPSQLGGLAEEASCPHPQAKLSRVSPSSPSPLLSLSWDHSQSSCLPETGKAQQCGTCSQHPPGTVAEVLPLVLLPRLGTHSGWRTGQASSQAVPFCAGEVRAGQAPFAGVGGETCPGGSTTSPSLGRGQAQG